MATHYEVLGVAPGATAGELRAAYVAKARTLHPDRHAGAAGDERRRVERAMQEVNVAWTVLSDPRARRDYDASLHRRATPTAGRPAGTHVGTARPAGPPPVVLPDFDGGHGGALPTLVRIAPVVFLLGVLGAIFVFTAFATGRRSVDAPPRSDTVEIGTPLVGSCVAIVQTVIEVSCDNPHALRVERHAPPGDDCRGGTVPLRWGDETTLCVRPPS
jgi:hypothetical protein